MGWKKVIHATDPNQSEIEIKYNRVDNYSILTNIQHANVCECADIYSSLFAQNPTKSLLHVIPYLGILDGIRDCHNFLGFSKCVFGIAGAVAKMFSFSAFHPNWKSINFKLF